MLHSKYIKISIVFTVFLGLQGCGNHVYHQVRAGDTLYSVSWRYSQSYEDVADWNAIEPPYIVKNGQWLRVAPPPVKPFGNESNHQVINRGSQSTIANVSLKQEFVAISSSTPQWKRQLNDGLGSMGKNNSNHLIWQWPLIGEISKKYDAKAVGKSGIAIQGHLGDIVKAAAAGKVVYSGNGLKGYGDLVIIKHNDKYLSAYGNHQVNLVKEGDVINAGRVIGRLGRAESGAVQLYFEIRIDGQPSNPLKYLPKARS